MNKKYIFAVLTMFLYTMPSLSMLQLTPQEEKARIEHICLLYANGMLNGYQYMMNGFFNQALIERDIALFKKDSQDLLSEKSYPQGLYASTIKPAYLKALGLISSAGLLAIGAAATALLYLSHNIWNSSIAFNWADKFAPTVIKLKDATLPERAASWKKYYELKYDYLIANISDKEKMILTTTPAALFGGVIGAIVLSMIARRSFSALAKHTTINNGIIERINEEYERNQRIIMLLQQIEYEAASRL